MTTGTDDVGVGSCGIAALTEVIAIADQAVYILTGIAATIEESQGTVSAIDKSGGRTGSTYIWSITLEAVVVSGNTADNTGSIGLQIVSSGADTAIVGTITGETVGEGAEETGSLSATHVKEQIVGDTGTTEIGHITTGTVIDVTGGTLTDTTREQSGLVADLTETIGRAGGAISQIADIAGTSNIGVDGIIRTILAVVETTTEGTIGNITKLADSTAEGVSGQAG